MDQRRHEIFILKAPLQQDFVMRRQPTPPLVLRSMIKISTAKVLNADKTIFVSFSFPLNERNEKSTLFRPVPPKKISLIPFISLSRRSIPFEAEACGRGTMAEEPYF